MEKCRRIGFLVFFIIVVFICSFLLYTYNQDCEISFNGFNYKVSKREATLISYTGSEKKIIMPDRVWLWKVTEIEDEAFYENDILESISFGRNIEKIGRRVFWGNVNLTEVVFNDGLRVIGAASFSGCTKLNEIYIPESVEVIRRDAFYKCESLKDISSNFKAWEIHAYAFQETAWWNQPQDGILLLNENVLIACVGVHDKMRIPEGVQYIAYDAFEECYCNTIIFPSTIIRANGSRFPEGYESVDIKIEGSGEVIHIEDGQFWGKSF